METGNSKKKKIIKHLLTQDLTPEERFKLSQLEPVEKEMEKQWRQTINDEPDLRIKELIWNKIQRKCNGKNTGKVHIKLWHSVAASIAVLLTVGTIWFTLITGDEDTEKYMEVIANQNQMYLLPDSSKVWMEPGSSIRYAKAFKKDRKVWLSGNSLFEVCKHEGSTFQVYIDKAFIEVKGTCFLIKQHNADQNEITLLSGSIDFNVETTNEKISMQPMQKMIYNPQEGRTLLEDFANISWDNGKYQLNEMPLKQLVKTINQLYNTNIILKRNLKKESAFTGTIRYDEPLDDVLNKICFSLDLKIEHINNEITIY